MKKIPLSNSEQFALVSDADFARLNKFVWRVADKRGRYQYAITGSTEKWIAMHDMVCTASLVDHRDCNTLNNQRRNLRPCSQQQNRANARKLAKASSKYKGVGWNKRWKHWRAMINFDGKQIFLGYFKVESDAARIYNQAAKRLFGKFARLNIL